MADVQALDIAAAAQEKAPCGYVGLKNLGATCYVNSLVQQLFMIPELRAALSLLGLSLVFRCSLPHPAASCSCNQLV